MALYNNVIRNSNQEKPNPENKLGFEFWEKVDQLPAIKQIKNFNEANARRAAMLAEKDRSGDSGLLIQGMQGVSDILGSVVGIPFQALEGAINEISDRSNIDPRTLGAIKDIIFYSKQAKISKSSKLYKNIQSTKQKINKTDFVQNIGKTDASQKQITIKADPVLDEIFKGSATKGIFKGNTNKLLTPAVPVKPSNISTLNTYDKGAEFAFKVQKGQPGGIAEFSEFEAVQGIRHFVKPDSPTARALNSSDPLMKSVQPISEILPHKSIREAEGVSLYDPARKIKAGGVSLYDPDRAVAIQQLITQKIHTAMEAGPKFVKEMFEEIWPHVDASELTTQQMKKKLTIALGSQTKAGGPVATSNLDRGLAEILLGDKKFLHDIGVIDEVVNNPSVLEPKNISKWLGGIDSRVSSTTGGIALHHTSLTASRDLLDNVNPQWRERFLNLMREKITPGAEGIVKLDALAHKPFSSPKIKNKSGKLVTDDTKWVVKGVLGDVLAEFTNLPKSTTGEILVNKEISNIGDWSKGLEGQLQRVIRSINDKAAHASWSRGTKGYTIDKRLGQFSPEDAFKVSEYIFDIERTISAQGVLVTQKLNNWKKAISKGKFGNPPNLEKALNNLQNSIDNIKIDESRIKSMEEAYQIRLDALLEGGPEALKKLETEGFIGPPRPEKLVETKLN